MVATSNTSLTSSHRSFWKSGLEMIPMSTPTMPTEATVPTAYSAVVMPRSSWLRAVRRLPVATSSMTTSSFVASPAEATTASGGSSEMGQAVPAPVDDAPESSSLWILTRTRP